MKTKNPPEKIKCGCGEWAEIGYYEDGTYDYLCEECDITFLEDGTVVS